MAATHTGSRNAESSATKALMEVQRPSRSHGAEAASPRLRNLSEWANLIMSYAAVTRVGLTLTDGCGVVHVQCPRLGAVEHSTLPGPG